MHDAGRQQVQHKRLVTDLHRVPGVVSALIAHDDVEPLGEQIDDLAFTFVAPLGADHCNHFRHEICALYFVLCSLYTVLSRALLKSLRTQERESKVQSTK